MRLISDVDWAEFFETVSLVDEIAARRQRLSREMDFATRDLYRTAIESWRAARSWRSSRSRGAPSAAAPARRDSARRRSARARSRLSPDRRGPAAASNGDRLPRRLALTCCAASLHRGRHRGLRRRRSRSMAGARAARCRCSACCSRRASTAACSGCWACSASLPAIDVAVALVNRAVTRRLRRDAAAGPRAARRRAGGAAHDGRRCRRC